MQDGMADGMTHIGAITDQAICQDMAMEVQDIFLTRITSLAYTTAPDTVPVPTGSLQETLPLEEVHQ